MAVCVAVCALIFSLSHTHLLHFSQDSSQYRNHGRPLIKHWLDSISRLGGGDGGHTPAMSLIIYCVTAEVRARRQHTIHLGSTVEERVRTDFKNLADE